MKKRFFITLGVGVLIVGGMAGGFFYLLTYKIYPEISEYLTVERSIRLFDRRIGDYGRIIEPGYERHKPELADIEHSFFTKGDELDFIIFLEHIVKRNHLTYTTAMPPTAEKPTMNFEVGGELKNILKFLREIENEKYLLRVDKITISGSKSLVAATIQMTLKSL